MDGGRVMTEEWTGQIDGAEVHDHALTAEEIASLAGKAAFAWRAPDGKVAYWPLNDPPLKRKRTDGVTGG